MLTMKYNIGEYCVLNNEIVPSHKLDIDISYYGKVLYEVIRVIENVPLFIEEHYERLEKSARNYMMEQLISLDELKNCVAKLLQANNMKECNIKIILRVDKEKNQYLMFINKSYYPTCIDYQRGTKVATANIERSNPNEKLVDDNYKNKCAEIMKRNNVFEILLVDKDEFITEGSRSNVFFVYKNEVITPPEEKVLKGITRSYIMEICKKNNIPIKQKLLSTVELAKIDGVFLTGTSIKVFPVASIDEIQYESAENEIINIISKNYNNEIAEYIKKYY